MTNDNEYVPLVVRTSTSFLIHDLSHHWFVTRLTRRTPLVEQALTTLPKLMNWLPVFSEVHVTRSLVICVYIVDRCFSFCTLILVNVLFVLQKVLKKIILVSSIYVFQCLSRLSCNVITFKTAATFCPFTDSDYPLDIFNLLLYWMDLDCRCLTPL